MADQTRREFLGRLRNGAVAIAAGAAVPAAEGRASALPPLSGDAPIGGPLATDPALDALGRLFAAPPDAAKPMTRWWWFGGAVTPAEITRELGFMREAGLRGAEIQPVYPVTVDDPARGVRHLRYFTPEWYDVLRHASREARRLGLQLDLTLGSGWPYGGPFVPPDLGARRLRLVTADIVGPRVFSWNTGPLLGEGERGAALLLAPVADDGAARIEGARVLDHRRRGATSGLEIPAGRWRVMLFVDAPTGMLVKRPTFGMEGLVVDHHNRQAIDLFLRAAGDRVFDAIGSQDGAPFHSIFCDSLEVFGADWTPRLLQEFERRRGYSLAPYLPALFADAGPLTPHVRYDYHLTLSDLLVDEFFAPLAAWSAKRGVKARVQAHGGMGDVMRGYGVSDIPEGENIFLGDRCQVNLKHRRLASSAAHIYGKPVASAETYTWLRTPTFTTTLEMMKAASDAVFLDGINQVVNHGYSYSPPEAGEPGWAFYASTEINHTQTWWRHYPHLARYVQRVSAMLQQGESVNPILVYLPMADVYAEHGVGGLHLDVEVQSRLDPAMLDEIRRAGYDFDVVNDHALAEVMRVEKGDGAAGGGEARASGATVLRGGTGRYRVMLVNDVRLMPPESAARIAEFVRAGGHLVAVGRLPEEAPGVKDREARTAAVRRAFAELWDGALPARAPASSGRFSAALVADVPAAIAQLARVLPPDFRIAEEREVGAGATAPPAARASAGRASSAAAQSPAGPARQHVGFVHRQVGEADAYFVANVSAAPRDLRVEFAAGHRRPHRWDPEAGRVAGELPYDYVTGGRVTSVELRLGPFESCFVVFGKGTEAPLVTATPAAGRWEIDRTGPRAEVRGLVSSGGRHALRGREGRARHVNAGSLPTVVAAGGPWTIALGGHAPVAIERLRRWDEIEGGRGFSGWGRYETDITLPEVGEDVEWFVDLGEVRETAEVFLNGRPLGAAWKGLRRVACGDAIRRGTNRLRIDVANLWIHHVLAHPPGDTARRLKGVGADPAVAETAGIRWGTYGEVPPEQVGPSGLIGPVTLVPMKRIRLTLASK
jgi:hypothetical protein